MITECQAARTVGILLVVLLTLMGCTLLRPAPEKKGIAAVMQPSDPERVQRKMPQPSTPAPLEPKYLAHTVQSAGETLIAIARWYTGHGDNWGRLAKANPGLDPRRMDIGDTILIPKELLTTRQPMPKATRAATTDKIKPLPATKPHAAAKDVKLFGPIGSAPSTPTADNVKLFGPIEDTPPPATEDSGLPRPLQTID